MASYEDVSSVFILSFSLYYVVEQVLRGIAGKWVHSPHFKATLRTTYKEPVYYGILMGATISILSTPFFCLTSRAVLWLSELNRLDLYFPYVAHHLSSAVMMVSALHFRFFEVLYIPYTSLISEVTGDLLWIMTAHSQHDLAWTTNMEAWRDRIKTLNVWVYAMCRLPSLPVLVWTVRRIYQRQWEHWDERMRVPLVAWAVLVLSAYSYWIMRYLRLQLKGVRWPITFEQPIRLYLPFGFILTLYGPLMGLALTSLVFVALIFTDSPSHTLASVISSAVLGARLMSLLFEDGINAFVKRPLLVFLRPGFWLHGGIIGAAFGLFVASEGELSQSIDLAAAFCIALPLYESISRIGCHSYGCCYGRPVGFNPSWVTKLFQPVVYTSSAAAAVRLNPTLLNKPLIPIQKISSLGFFLQFILNVILLAKTHLPLSVVAGISLTLHAAIRLWTERYRDDYRGKAAPKSPLSVTRVIALLQLVVVGPSFSAYAEGLRPIKANSVDWKDFRQVLQEPLLGAIFLGGTAVYGLHRGEVGKGLLG
ncbi:Prolipo protein diacylglyceryl transferase-domain-containing protein [Flagelloscypha sp. PMI_526]|nr:Prolipo protein diacylglyceryl transferase-domain-containing protein [Flagelloscypha sp. PMI_526]